MLIHKCTLIHFRNHVKLDIPFDSVCTAIIGENGAGKTSLLEAIHAVATTKSFKGNREVDSIQYNAKYASIELLGAFKDDVEALRITYERTSLTHVRKQCSVDGRIIPPTKFIGNLYTILFTTDLINNFTDKSTIRRKFFNQFLCQLDNEYLRLLTLYERVLRERTTLLKMVREGSDPLTLHYWNEQLLFYGRQVIEKRFAIITSLQSFLGGLRHPSYEIRLMYNTPFLTCLETQADLLQAMKQMLAEKQTQEVASGRCLLGPHRDDYDIFLNDKNIKEFASRGEQKVSIGFLLHAMALYILHTKDVKPIILLDDVKAEMDMRNFQTLINLFYDEKFQLIVTALEEGIYNLPKMKSISLERAYVNN